MSENVLDLFMLLLAYEINAFKICCSMSERIAMKFLTACGTTASLAATTEYSCLAASSANSCFFSGTYRTHLSGATASPSPSGCAPCVGEQTRWLSLPLFLGHSPASNILKPIIINSFQNRKQESIERLFSNYPRPSLASELLHLLQFRSLNIKSSHKIVHLRLNFLTDLCLVEVA